MIASKLDQMLDSRGERVRRDSLLGFLLGFLPFSVSEATTRRLEPLTAAEKRSGDLL